MAANEATYLYCFARADAVGELKSPGIDGQARVEAICGAKTAAICSPAPLEGFCSGSESEREPDLQWLIPRVCRHQAVIEEVMTRSPVLPVRFGALFSSPGAVETLMARRASQIDDFLEFIAGKCEWAVKGFLSTKAATAWLLEAEPEWTARRHSLPVSPGKRYFEEKQLNAAAERETRQWARAVAAELLETLKDVAFDYRALKLQPQPHADGAGEMIFNLAFLLDRSRVEEFIARVESLAAQSAKRGLTLQSSGPWPPFSFCPSFEKSLT